MYGNDVLSCYLHLICTFQNDFDVAESDSNDMVVNLLKFAIIMNKERVTNE